MVNLIYNETKLAHEDCGHRILVDSKNHSNIKRTDCCLKLLKRKSYMRASLSFRISFISDLRYYFPAFHCFCASCVEWRFQVKILITYSSNQRNSLSKDFQTSSLVLCTVYFLIYFILHFPYSIASVSCKVLATVL